eukprot:g45836.t1
MIAKCTGGSFLTSAPPNSSISVHLLVKIKNKQLSGAITRHCRIGFEPRKCAPKSIRTDSNHSFSLEIFRGKICGSNAPDMCVARTRLPGTYSLYFPGGSNEAPNTYRVPLSGLFRTTTVTRHRFSQYADNNTNLAQSDTVKQLATLSYSSPTFCYHTVLLERGRYLPIALTEGACSALL